MYIFGITNMSSVSLNYYAYLKTAKLWTKYTINTYYWLRSYGRHWLFKDMSKGSKSRGPFNENSNIIKKL